MAGPKAGKGGGGGYFPKIRLQSSKNVFRLYLFLLAFCILYLFSGLENKFKSKPQGESSAPTRRRYAYVTLLCDDIMADATMVLVHSVKRTGTPHDMVILTMNVSNRTLFALQQVGAVIEPIIEPVPYPFAITSDRLAINKPCRYSKLLMWKMIQYDKMVYLDSDLLIVRNIDNLFERDQITAVPDTLPPDKFNSGLMVIEPNMKTFQDMLKKVATTISPNVGDQGFLNSYFSDWYSLPSSHHLDYSYNTLIRISTTQIWKFFVGSGVKVLHFSGSTKPWNMMVDKQFPTTRKYDSIWWHVYDECYELLAKKISALSSTSTTGTISSSSSSTINSAGAVAFSVPNPELTLLTPLSPQCRRNYMAYKRKDPIEDKLSVILNCFDRFDLLTYMIHRYSEVFFIHKIYVVWGNTHISPFPPSYFNVSIPIEIIYTGIDSLNDRFKPIESLETEGVLLCDDDIEVDIQSLYVAFKRWQKDKYRLVGFFPRAHYRNPQTGNLVYVLSPKQEYSIVLTKMFVMHADYLRTYTCDVPQELRDYVDRNKNCEDISMNFVVTQLSGLPPLLIEDSSKRDYGTTSGLSSRGSHDFSRSVCMNDIEHMLGFMSLRNTSETIVYFERHKAVRIPRVRQLARASKIKFKPIFNDKEFSIRLQFMSSLEFPNQYHSVDLATVPSSSLSMILCIAGNNVKDFSDNSNKYTLLDFGTVPPDTIHLSGSTFIIHSQFGFEGRFHFLSLLSNFLPWQKNHGCFGPSRILLYHDGKLVNNLNFWAVRLISALFGSYTKVYVPHDISTPVCFENAVVSRQRDTVNPDECDPHINEARHLVWAYCMNKYRTKVPELFTESESSARILFVGEERNWLKTGWFDFGEMIAEIKEDCSDVGLACEFQWVTDGDFCKTQVLGYNKADILIGLWGDRMFDSLVFLKGRTSVLELLPQGLDPQETDQAITIARNCLHLQYTQHLVNFGMEGVLSWINLQLEHLARHGRITVTREYSPLERCFSMNVHT